MLFPKALLLTVKQEMLTEVTETGTIQSIVNRNRQTIVNIKTLNGRRTVELPPPGHNLGVETQINVRGKVPLEYLKRGMTIHVKCKIDKRNRITEPVEEIVLFTPNRTTSFGIQEEPLDADGDVRPVSIVTNVTSIKDGKIITRFASKNRWRRLEVPVKEGIEIELNGSDFRFASPGDEITAVGHVIRKPILMAHTINIVRAKKPGEKAGDDGKNKKGVAAKPANAKLKAGKKQVAGKENKAGKAGAKVEPAKMIAIDDKKDKKRTRIRKGRAYKIN